VVLPLGISKRQGLRLIEEYRAYITVGLIFLLLFNAGVTLALARDDGLSPVQKSVQIVVVWVLPFIGGVLMLALVGSHHTRDELRSMAPFPFYLAGRPHLKTPVAPNPIEGHGAEGSCGGGIEAGGDSD